MSYLNITDVATYTPPENTSLIYKESEGVFKYKTSAGLNGDVTSSVLPLLAVELTDIPCLVFTEDLNAALAKTVVPVENVTVAMSSKAVAAYTDEIAKRKVDKTDFLSALSRTGEAIEELQSDVADNKAAVEAAAAKAAANETAIATEITDRGTAITEAKEELAGDIDAVEERIGAAETEISAIKAELNGGVEGGEGNASVTERLAALEGATAVETTDDAPIVVPVDRDGDGENEASKLNDAYAPVLKFNGTAVGVLNNEINVIGDGSVSVVNGVVTLRLGPNLNSSAFNTSDGHADRGGALAVASGIPTANKVLSNGVTKAVWMTGGDVSVNTTKNGNAVTSSNKINAFHFDSAETTFDVTVGTHTWSIGPITGNGTYSNEPGSDNPLVEIVVSNWTAEPKTGATGYCANVVFTIAIGDMGLIDGEYTIVIQHVGSNGAAKFTSGKFYIVNDDVTKAVASNAAVTLTGTSAKTISGVSYLTAGTVTASADIANAFTPASSGANGSSIAYDINGWASDPSADNLTYTENGKSAASSTTLIDGQYASDATTVKITPSNINGNGTAVTASLGKALLIDKTSQGTGTDLTEPFESETRRLTEALGAWDSTWSLADGADGDEGLMIKSGALIYPTGTYTDCNDGFNNIVGANQPDYSACTGVRSYVRKLYKNASLGGGIFTISHNKSLSSFVTAGTLTLEVSKDGSTWYDITKLVKDGGIGTAFTWGSTSTSITFAFTNGTADKNIYVRIAMASSSVDVQITNLEANLA